MAVTSPISFLQTGIEVIDPCLSLGEVDRLCALCDPLLKETSQRRPGVRRVFLKEPRLIDVLRETMVSELIRMAGGPDARVVRAILFDKTPETNWLVPWHQDASIAVVERRDVPGFGPWAVKDGEHHCQPPLDVLKSIFTLRVHLDACPAEAGPLRVILGSHTQGLLDEATLNRCVREGRSREAITGRGAVVLTMPLAVHSSPKATSPSSRRRVLHLDCTAARLPGGLRFAEAA